MNSTELKHNSYKETGQSAINYVNVTFTGGFYAPTVAFKGLFIGVAGNVVLTGADGVAVTMALDTGVFPFGGIKITETGTTATSIVALS
jgi:hypothetical protein|tara:strand:+ start:1911 stop:2177 length:267 start_codon:yes stop_codon:yes gene_type:complete